ncbi:YtzI protein [Lottiidibacillus patelloidae]|uniref:YtzI protein n=1 Tax=Lottiidibacillus patelloidae TaxID=2670334 RepID=UPI001155177E|nr:YtzI protein [Lottiidibacillus patelloidae]
MTTMMWIMIVSFVIIAIVVGLTIAVTNKAYEVLPEASKIDPLPEDKKEQSAEENR